MDTPLRPIERALVHCTEKGVDFDAIFAQYLGNPQGYMVSTPEVFALGKPADFEEGRYGWFLALAAGNLLDLLRLMPYDLPYIGFYRNGTGPLKVYSSQRFVRLAERALL